MTTKTPVKGKLVKLGKVEDDVRFDVRLRSRNLREGTLSRAEVDKYLKSLPDLGDTTDSVADKD